MAYNPINPNGQATMANSEPVVIASDQSAIPVSGTVTATATNLDIRDLVFASDKVDVSGSTGVGVTGTFWQATQPVSATDLDIRNLVFATDKVDVSGSTSVGVTGTFWQATQPVSATDLDIRNLVFATDKVDVSGSTGLGVTGTVTVTDVATEVTLASLLTSSQLIDDTIIVLGTDVYTEAASKGQIIAAVRRDADTTLVNTTNEYGPLQMDANGRLKVEVFSGETLPVSGTVAATQSGTWNIGTVTTVTGVTTVSTLTNITNWGNIVDNAQFTDGTTRLLMTGYIYDEVAGTALTENDAAAARINVNRAQVATIEDGVTRGRYATVSASNALKVDGSAVTQPISGTITVTGVSTLAEQQTQTTHLATIAGDTTDIETAIELIDDSVVTLGTTTYTEATSKALTIGAIRRDADTSAVNTDNEFAPLIVDALGRLKVEVFSGETLPVSLTSTTITGSVAVTATDLDIRNLVFATDKVDASGTTLGANSGVDIGDVTINNAAGASAVNIQDGGNTITVDGTVAISGTVPVSATNLDIRDLTFAADKVDASGTVLGAGNNNIGDVDVASIAAGTNYIGKVRLTDGTTDGEVVPLAGYNAQAVAIVDGSGAQITSFGGGTQYTEDVAAAADPVGTAPILVRADSPAATVTTDGDNIAQRGTNYGAAYVTLLDTAGSPVSVGGGTQYTEDVASAADPIGTMLIGVVDTGNNDTVTTDGDNMAARMNANGALYSSQTTQAYPAAVVMQNAATGTGNGTLLDVRGYNTAIIAVQGASTPDAIINIEASIDDSTWNLIPYFSITSELVSKNSILTTVNNLFYSVNVAGYKSVRARIDSITSGTVTVNGYRQAVGSTHTHAKVEQSDPTLLNTTAYIGQTDYLGDPLTYNFGSFGAMNVIMNDSAGTPLPVSIHGTSAGTPTGIMMMGADTTFDAKAIRTNTIGQLDVAVGTGLSHAISDGASMSEWLGTNPMTNFTLPVTMFVVNNGSGLSERARGAINATNSAGTGIQATGILAQFDDVSPTAITENNFGNLRMSANRNQYVTLRDAAGNERGVNINANNELQVTTASSVVLGTATYTEATSTGVAFAAVRRDANTTLVNTTNEFAPLQVNAIGGLKVAADVAVPVNVQIGNATLSAGVIDETGASAVDALAVGGGTAHDAVDSGNPIKTGAVAIAHGTNPTQVAAADRTHLYANRHGIPYHIGGHPNIVSAEYFTSGAITDDNILPAISAGTKYVITSITVACSAANATTPAVRIGFGATTLTAQGATNADAVTKIILSHPGIPAGSGIVKGNGAGIVGIGGDGEELRITCTTPTTSMTVQVDYYTIES